MENSARCPGPQPVQLPGSIPDSSHHKVPFMYRSVSCFQLLSPSPLFQLFLPQFTFCHTLWLGKSVTLPHAGSIVIMIVLCTIYVNMYISSSRSLPSVEGAWITTCKLNLQKLLFRERKLTLTDPLENTQRIMEESGTEASSSQTPTNALATNFPFCGALLWFPATCPYHHKCFSPVVYLLSSFLHQLVPSSPLSSTK